MAEQIIWKGGRSPLSLLSYWIIGVLTLILLGLGLIVLLLGVIELYKKRYFVTTERVKSENGFLSRTVRDAELDKIQDTMVRQNFLGRLLNYGDLYFSTAGSGSYEIVFEKVADPEGLKTKIRELKKKA
ncbi:MAG: PH domain-containing protein [Candidatus Altiarchaeota archaeon]|nr:PH domain-containing protein [Candidatus Altiarchaeota archaeon]